MKKKLRTWLEIVLVKYSKILTFLGILLGAAGFYFGSFIQLKLSLTDLLPQEHPSVQKFEKLTQVVGGVGYLIVVLDAPDGKSHLSVAPKIIERLRSSSEVRSVFYHREQGFFIDRMLYYLEISQLNELEDTIKKQLKKAKQDIFDLGLWDEGKEKEAEPAPIDSKLKEAAQKSAKISPYLISKDAKHLLIMIKPSFDSTDLNRSKDLIGMVEKNVRELLPATVSYRLTGRYQSKVIETEMIQKDIFFLGFLSVFLVVFVLFIYLREWRGLVLVLTPVLMGLGITSGFAYWHIGHINLITGFLIGIVSGLGVDYGIHLLLRLRMEARDGSMEGGDPVWRALQSSGRSVFTGAMAASLSFYLLCFSSFRAFSEFGYICGTGIISVFACLLFSFSFLAKALRLDRPREFRPFPFPKLPLLSAKAPFWVGTALTVALFALSFRVQFEYDFSKMLQHSKEVRELNALVDAIYERSTSPSAFAAPDKQMGLDVEELLKKDYIPSVVQQIVSGASIIPEKQDEKTVILLRIKDLIGSLKDKWIEKAIDIRASSIRKWVDAKTFRFEDLPLHIKDALRGTGQKDFLIYIYPEVELDNAKGVYTYADMIRTVERKFPELLTGSDAVVFADILDLINKDGLIILIVMILTVGVFIWISSSNVRDLLWTYIPLLVALPVGMGLMAVFGIKFNIFNISIIPTFVAMAIDVPIHIVHRTHETGSGFKSARDLAASINLALLTAGLGFGVLVFARTGVLQSLGWIALMGTAAIWWVGLLVLPAFLERATKSKSISEHAPLHSMGGGSH